MDKHFCPYCMNVVPEGEVCGHCGLTAGTYKPNQNHLPPGTILENRYLVGRVLGEGGFGITYIGCDLKLELKVAIKEYYPADKVQRISDVSLEVSIPSTHAEPAFLSGKKRFLQEALIMAQMDKQPEIVGVRDFFECNNTAYIVMEYVEGTTFKQLVAQRGGGIPAKELLPLLEPLFGALSNLHATGLIHRDISPDNLMLERGAVRLLDFGCARQPEKGEATMTIILKHGYAPIEQYTNRGQGPWTDVYALSATIYFCLVGKTPPQAMDRAVEDELILPRKLGVDLTETQEKALIRGMGVKRSQRFASVDELHAALYQKPADLKPIQVRLNIQNILKNSDERGGFSYELVDTDGKVLKTASTDSQGRAGFALTFDKEAAGCTYAYTIRQVNTELPNVTYSNESYAVDILIRNRGGQLCAEVKKDGQQVSAEEIFSFHNIYRKPRPKPQPKPKPKPTEEVRDDAVTILLDEDGNIRKSRKKLWIGAGCIGAAVLLLLLVMVPRWLNSGAGEADPAQEGTQVFGEEPSTEETEPPAEETEPAPVFNYGEAVVFNGDEETELIALLENENISAIFLSSGHVSLSRIISINKPVLIGEDSSLLVYGEVIIEAEGLLQVEGELELGHVFTVLEGGHLVVGENANVYGDGLLLLQNRDSAFAGTSEKKQQEIEDNGGRTYVFHEGSLQAQATEVTSEAELRAALENPETVAIRITADLQTSEEYLSSVPIYVDEGVTFTAGDAENDTGWLQLAEGGALINSGVFHGCLNAGGKALVLNYGTYNARSYFVDGLTFLNCGSLYQSSGTQIFDGAMLFNLGQMNLNSWFSVVGGGVCNYGEILVYDSLNLERAGRLTNYGSIELLDGGTLWNRAYIRNLGDLQIQSRGTLHNLALLEIGDGFLGQQEGGTLNNDGLIQYNDASRLPYEEEALGMAYHIIDDWTGGAEVVQVFDTQGFLDAHNNENVAVIDICGEVVLDGSAVVHQNLHIQSGASLTLENNSSLEITGVVHNEGTISANVIGLYDGGQITNSGLVDVGYMEVADRNVEGSRGAVLNYGEVRNNVELCIASDGAFMNYGSISGVINTLTIEANAVLAQFGQLQATQQQVNLSGGQLILMTSQQFSGGTIDMLYGPAALKVYGDLWLNADLNIHEDNYVDVSMSQFSVGTLVRVFNRGGMDFMGYDEFTTNFGGTLENYGTVNLGIPFCLKGELQNEGTINVYDPAYLQIEGTYSGNAANPTYGG